MVLNNIWGCEQRDVLGIKQYRHSQADQEDQQGRRVRWLQTFPVIKHETRLTWEQFSLFSKWMWITVVELLFSNTWERCQTYSLSLWSSGSLRPWQTSVSLLSLLSWGSNETDKTWVSLLSLGTGVSTQTKQTRRSLQEERREMVEERQEKQEMTRERGWQRWK